ncbi:MAG: CHASE2 domain-containing protein [Rubrivivax sp.]
MPAGWRRAGAAALLLFGALAPWLPPFAGWNLRLHDTSLRWKAALQPPPPAPLVVVALDEASLEALPGPLALMHGELALLFEALAAARPLAVAVDLVLPARSYDTLVPGGDEKLLRAIVELRAAAPLVLGRTVDAGGRALPLHRPFAAAAGEEGSAFVLLPADGDGVVRRFDETLGADGSRVPTLAGTVARRTGHPAAEGFVDFSRTGRPALLPLHEALAWARAGERARLAAAFGGRTVFVGASLPFDDRHRTPLQPAGETVPGVLVQLQVAQALQQGWLLQPLPAWAQALAGVLLAAAGLAAKGAVRALGMCAAATMGLVGAQWLALRSGFTLPLAGWAAAAALPALARLAADSAAEIAERRRLRAAFAGYVSPAVMQALEAGRLQGMASERRFIAVLFMDIRGFTTRAESTPPEAVIATLNTAFETVTALIHRHGGTVKEFMGDGVLAFFGAPQALPNPAQSAFDAARAIVGALPSINAALQSSGQPPLKVGLGLACGEAVVGHVGASTRHAYGAVGDCVNVASRLEGLTNERGHVLLMSDALRRALADAEGVQPLGEAALKGHSPVAIHAWDPPPHTGVGGD